MYLHIISPGMLTTIQDLGRGSYRAFGLPCAGAMDALSLKIANILAGNPPGTAALEITLVGPSITFEGFGIMALTGADLGARLNGWHLPAAGSFVVNDGDRLTFSGSDSGCRCYLAARGGYVLPQVMGSYSTYLRGEFGGYRGRALKAGDHLNVADTPVGGQAPFWVGSLPSLSGLLNIYSDSKSSCPVVRVIMGPQDDYFDDESIALFLSTEWQVSNEADRMGYRLSGATLKHRNKKEIVSDGILSGAIQVPAQGIPIVLLADAQTAGGYPKIATVISSDLRIFGQLQPGDFVRFTSVDREEAVRALKEEERIQNELITLVACQPAGQPAPYEVFIDGQSYKVTVQRVYKCI